MGLRTLTFNETVQFFVEDCCNCGIPFAMTQEFKNKRVHDGKNFYCPNGHSQCYTENTAKRIARLEAEKTALQARVNSERERANNAETARKRETTRRKNLQKRVTAGCCPYCQRNFSQLTRHIHSKHPDKEHVATGELV